MLWHPIQIIFLLFPGLEVIKLEFSLKLKIKINDWQLADTWQQAAINSLYYEFEIDLKFYNLEAWVKLV